MRGIVRGVVAGGATAMLLVTASPGTALAASPPEVPPPGAVCRYNDTELVNKNLVGASAAAATTWPQHRLEYSDAWQYSLGAGQVVAVVDSGVDAQVKGFAGTGVVLPGIDVTSGSKKPGGLTDCFGHGTGVAGIIASQRQPGRSWIGVAPKAKIRPIRQTWGIDANTREISGSADHLILALRAAVEAPGTTIINVSVTTPENALTQVERKGFDAVVKAARDRGILIVAATGNRTNDPNADPNPVNYPAGLSTTFDNVIAVSGINEDGTPDQAAITGPYVSLTAPSQNLTCLFPGLHDNSGLLACNGTSFAAPFVSGIAALVRSRFPDNTPGQIRQRLEVTADHPSTALPDPTVGYGVPNPLAAMTAVVPGDVPPTVTPAATPPKPIVVEHDDRTTRAMILAGSALLAAIVLALGRVAYRRGRERGWQSEVRVVKDDERTRTGSRS